MAADSGFDLREALGELESAGRVDAIGEDETILEEDTHEDISKEE